MKHLTKESRTGYQLILLASILYGSYGVWSRLMGSDFSPFYQAYVRSAIILLIMAPFLWYTKSFRRIARRDWPALAVFIGFCIFTQVPLYFAYNHAPIGMVQFVFYAMLIVATYTMGRLYIGELITKVKLVSLVLAVSGLAIIFGINIGQAALLGLALAALNGIASGSEQTSSKRLTQRYSPGLIIFWGWLFTLLTHIPLSLILGEPQPQPAVTAAWGYLLVYAVVNAIAFWMGIEGFKHVDASTGSLLGLTEVIFTTVFGWMLFHERLSWTFFVGSALIISAAMLPDLAAILQQRRKIETTVEPVIDL